MIRWSVSYQEGKDFIDKYEKILFFEMSVKLYINVEEVFHSIVGEINKYQDIDLGIEEKKRLFDNVKLFTFQM